jgi:hypothetical protein
MAVPALELKPRQTIALFDAALRLCARSAGVWSLTLPAGAAVVATAFLLVDSIDHHRPILEPAIYFTAAWLFRAISMGAACHFLEAQVLRPTEPSVWGSFRAALARAPSLFITAGLTLFLNGLLWTLTLGVGLLFIGSQNVAYAVAMRGQGHPLAAYGAASKLLGPARHTAAWIRLCGLSQLLVALNLHSLVAMTLYAGKALFALDLTFFDRFASFDNPTWVTAVIATTFALFEPLRAATATLLLIDGRVRQEGLDLLATLEQLPRRRKPKAALAVAALLLLFLPAISEANDEGKALAEPSHEADDWSGQYTPGQAAEAPASTQLGQRLSAVVEECGLENQISPADLDAVDHVSAQSQSSLSRFVGRVERSAFDDEDCETAAAQLKRGLELASQAQAIEKAIADSPRDEAKAILERPEFVVDPPKELKPKDDEQPPNAFEKWWRDLWDAFWRWLRNQEKQEDRAPVSSPNVSFSALGLVDVVIIAAVAGVLVLFGWLLLRGREPKAGAGLDADVSALTETALSTDPMSALARAPESWAGLADQLARDGKFREAIRHLYLASLSRLHRDGAIDYDPAKSNWDYFRAFKGPGALLPAFREATRRFDFAWYGNLEVSPASWQTFRGLCEPILAAAALSAA